MEPIDKKIAPAYTWGEICKSFVLLNSAGLSVKQELMPLDTKEKLHFHDQAQQFFFILKGEATFFLDGETILLSKNIYCESRKLRIRIPGDLSTGYD